MPIPADWENVYQDPHITECIPLFLETDALQYADMTLAYCRDKLDSTCMWLWRKRGIDWTDEAAVRADGIALAFHLWRPRYSNGQPIENRYCPCLFLGSAQNASTSLVNNLKAAVTAFADDMGARHAFYIVKQARVTYARRVEDVFSQVLNRLVHKPAAPAEWGWPERNVWQVENWA
jgi:hypothetical protein